MIAAIKHTNFQLLLIRKPNNEILNLLNQNHIKYEWHSDISRSDVYECYKKCDIVFFASEYEGFGVPILEANMIGRPVITSNISAMPFVASDAALLINPFNIMEIREGLLKIRDDIDFRKSLIDKGRLNVIRFSKERIADDYYNLYKEVLNKQ